MAHWACQLCTAITIATPINRWQQKWVGWLCVHPNQVLIWCVCVYLHDAHWVEGHWSETVSTSEDINMFSVYVSVCEREWCTFCIDCVLADMVDDLDMCLQEVCEDSGVCFLPCLKTPMSRALSASLSHQSAGTSAWNGWGIQISSSLC